MTICKRQDYHLEPPQGLMNDPNGLVWFRGRYYVFFQWNPYSKDHSHKEWGLYASRDLVHWTFEGSALETTEAYDHSGVYSGSALVIGQRLHLFYTGIDKGEDHKRSSQCLAVSEDGREFEKRGVLLETPAGFTRHFRDPKVLSTEQDGYYMVIGAQRRNGRGAVALGRSPDGSHWQYVGLLATMDSVEMVECPDLFRLNGQYILLYCPQRRDNDRDAALESWAAYQPVAFDEQTGTLETSSLDKGGRRLDAGFDFYAPQTFETQDGRRMLFAWMSRMDEAQEAAFAEHEPRIHCQTLPRELRWENGTLYQQPARELYSMLGKEVVPENGRLNTRCYRLALEADCPAGLTLHMGEAALHWDGGTLTLTRRNWAGPEETRACTLHQLKQLEVWSDTSSLEIFVNHGEAVFSARVFPQTETAVLTVDGLPPQHTLSIRELELTGGFVS